MCIHLGQTAPLPLGRLRAMQNDTCPDVLSDSCTGVDIEWHQSACQFGQPRGLGTTQKSRKSRQTSQPRSRPSVQILKGSPGEFYGPLQQCPFSKQCRHFETASAVFSVSLSRSRSTSDRSAMTALSCTIIALRSWNLRMIGP